MTSAAETYRAWFDRLSPSVRDELAVVLMRSFPGDLLTSPIALENPADGFTQRLTRLAVDPVKAAGVAVAIAALTDFAFIERSSSQEFDHSEAMLDLLDEVREEHLDETDPLKEQLADWIEGTKLRHPLRSRQWLRAFESWKELRAGDLAPDAIHRSMRGL
jgi:hypothetical protein